MNKESLIPSSTNLPAPWRAEVQAQLVADEKVVAWLELDLDISLKFMRGLVLVTDRRLLATKEGGHGWTAWDYRSGSVLKHHDHAGVGSLEIGRAHV